MSSKSLLKFIVAFGILAILLAFLGVNYVPRIFASSSTSEDQAVTSSLAVPVYLNQRYPRSISPQLSYDGSDFFQRQAAALALPKWENNGADFFQRQAASLAIPIAKVSSDFLNRHPYDVTPKLKLDSSEFLNHHPYDVSQLLKSALSDNREPLTSEDFSDSD
jgi:hypothetical protein